MRTSDFRRLYPIYFVSLFIPSLCLIAAAEITLYVDQSHFDATIMVALTSTLVMYTLYTGINDKLPVSSSIKMIDIWLLQGILTPFLVFIVLAISKLLKEHKKQVCPTTKEMDTRGVKRKTKERTFRQVSQVVIPFLSCFFVITFFLIAFINLD